MQGCFAFLQTVGQLDIGFFVKTSTQLNDYRDFLAGPRRIYQRIRQTVAAAEAARPDVLVSIDSPAFTPGMELDSALLKKLLPGEAP